MNVIDIKLNSNIESKIIIQENINIDNYLEDKRYFLITNGTIAKIYSGFIKKFDNVIIIKDGEEYATLDATVSGEKVWSKLFG